MAESFFTSFFSQLKFSVSDIDVSIAPNEKKTKRGSFVRHNKSLSSQVIPEISHESQDEDNKTVLENGHLAGCNINRHLRFETENSSGIQSKFPATRVISVIEEASV